jgi:hypothetical protein
VPTTLASRAEQNAWIEKAKAHGFIVNREKRETICIVNGKRTNIKFSRLDQNRGRFSLGSSYLKDVDAFVFIIEKHDDFFAIPQERMRELVRQTTRDSATNRPVFNINVKTKEYFPGSGKIGIAEYWRKWDFFKERIETLPELEEEFEGKEQKAARKLGSLSHSEIDHRLEKFRVPSGELVYAEDKPRPSGTNRYDRNAELSALMKAKANYTCQVCGSKSFEGKDGRDYVETHHVVPREKKGADSPNNIVVVCPTCHKKFDKGSVRTQVEVYRILRMKGLFSNFRLLADVGEISETIYQGIMS